MDRLSSYQSHFINLYFAWGNFKSGDEHNGDQIITQDCLKRKSDTIEKLGFLKIKSDINAKELVCIPSEIENVIESVVKKSSFYSTWHSNSSCLKKANAIELYLKSQGFFHASSSAESFHINLFWAWTYFKSGDITSGKFFFNEACAYSGSQQNELYRYMWVVKGSDPHVVTEFGRLCFHDSESYSSTAEEKALAIKKILENKEFPFPAYYNFPFIHLYVSQKYFKNGDVQNAKINFNKAHSDYQNRVFKKLWEIKGRPEGNSQFGEQCFFDINGLSSTSIEKARAIELYLKSDHTHFLFHVSFSSQSFVPVHRNLGSLVKVIDYKAFGDQFLLPVNYGLSSLVEYINDASVKMDALSNEDRIDICKNIKHQILVLIEITNISINELTEINNELEKDLDKNIYNCVSMSKILRDLEDEIKEVENQLVGFNTKKKELKNEINKLAGEINKIKKSIEAEETKRFDAAIDWIPGVGLIGGLYTGRYKRIIPLYSPIAGIVSITTQTLEKEKQRFDLKNDELTDLNFSREHVKNIIRDKRLSKNYNHKNMKELELEKFLKESEIKQLGQTLTHVRNINLELKKLLVKYHFLNFNVEIAQTLIELNEFDTKEFLSLSKEVKALQEFTEFSAYKHKIAKVVPLNDHF